jgi:hypothetical protein
MTDPTGFSLDGEEAAQMPLHLPLAEELSGDDVVKAAAGVMRDHVLKFHPGAGAAQMVGCSR